MTGPNHQPPGSRQSTGKAKRRLSPGEIVGAVLLVLALVFIFENTKKVDVRLIFPEVHAPLFVALLIAALLGALGVLLLQARRRRRG